MNQVKHEVEEQKRGETICPFMNIVVKSVVMPLNNWSFHQMMRISLHARHVVTGIPTGSCLRFHADLPR